MHEEVNCNTHNYPYDLYTSCPETQLNFPVQGWMGVWVWVCVWEGGGGGGGGGGNE